MNTYSIQHRVKTLAQLEFVSSDWEETIPIDIDGYSIRQQWHSLERWIYGDTWIVKKEVEWENWIDALNLFRRGFNKIAERLSFVSQCSLEFLDQSRLIEKTNDNPDKIFQVCIIDETKPVGLHIGQKDIDNYNNLKDICNDNPFFMYMNAVSSTIWYHAKLSLLCSALEALAGKKEKINEKWVIYYTTYDVEEMKTILSTQDDYDKIFGPGWRWLRHKIQHGDFIDRFNWTDYVSWIYTKILEYFNKWPLESKHKLDLDLDIISPQRNLYKNTSQTTLFLKPEKTTTIIKLENILILWEENRKNNIWQRGDVYKEWFCSITPLDG